MLEKVINKLLLINHDINEIDELLTESPKDELLLRQRQKLYHQRWILEELLYD